MVAAIIVLYFPELETVNALISSVANQVDTIIIVDNTPNVFDAFLSSEKNQYIPLGDNFGIAKAQNVGLAEAEHKGHKYALLLDQDSHLSPGLVNTLISASENLTAQGKQVAAVGPIYRDRKTNEYAQAIRFKYFHLASRRLDPTITTPLEADYLIASGSLISIDAIKKIGNMMEQLFIDGVDVEWGQRARSKGYSFFIIPQAIMTHSLGDKFINLFGKNVILHADIRNYYIVRNSCFLLTQSYVDIWWKITICLRLPLYITVYTLTSPQKMRALRNLIAGCVWGFKGQLGRALLQS